ncbi:MAG: IS607 family transposase [Nostoc sp.]
MPLMLIGWTKLNIEYIFCDSFAMAKYVKPNEAANTLGVCLRTLRRWEANGEISTVKTPSGQRRYDIEKFINKESEPDGGRATVVYARVSTRPQKADLDRQVERLSALYPGAEVVKEVGGAVLKVAHQFFSVSF